MNAYAGRAKTFCVTWQGQTGKLQSSDIVKMMIADLNCCRFQECSNGSKNLHTSSSFCVLTHDGLVSVQALRPPFTSLHRGRSMTIMKRTISAIPKQDFSELANHALPYTLHTAANFWCLWFKLCLRRGRPESL